jgi:hypothetical protein
MEKSVFKMNGVTTRNINRPNQDGARLSNSNDAGSSAESLYESMRRQGTSPGSGEALHQEVQGAVSPEGSTESCSTCE